MKRIDLIVEHSEGSLFGRVNFEDNLITEDASTLEELQSKMKQVLKDFHDLDEVAFNICYDLTSLFEEFSFLNVNDIARRASINAGLFRQYVSGVKYPSSERAQKIENIIHDLGKRMQTISVVANANI